MDYRQVDWTIHGQMVNWELGPSNLPPLEEVFTFQTITTTKLFDFPWILIEYFHLIPLLFRLIIFYSFGGQKLVVIILSISIYSGSSQILFVVGGVN